MKDPIGDIMENAAKRLLCRISHQTYGNLCLAALHESVVDLELCEFGNDKEHNDFFMEEISHERPHGRY